MLTITLPLMYVGFKSFTVCYYIVSVNGMGKFSLSDISITVIVNGNKTGCHIVSLLCGVVYGKN